MTREEEIKQAAKNRADQYEHPVDWNDCYHHFIQGSEWADKNPRKGLWDSEKVVDWILNNYELYVSLSDQICSLNNFTSMSNFVEYFKNYMQNAAI